MKHAKVLANAWAVMTYRIRWWQPRSAIVKKKITKSMRDVLSTEELQCRRIQYIASVVTQLRQNNLNFLKVQHQKNTLRNFWEIYVQQSNLSFNKTSEEWKNRRDIYIPQRKLLFNMQEATL